MPGPNQYYVDPSINANSGTGTIGDPFGDLQYCLNTITRSTTVGDQVNIKAGTPESMTTAISLATYGTPTKLILAGYTSAADDGGIGEITFNGNNTNVFSSQLNIDLRSLKIGNFGTGSLLVGASQITHCEIHTFSGTITTQGNFYYNHVHTHTGTNLCVQMNGAVVAFNILRSSTNWAVAYGNGSGGLFLGNVVVHSNTVGSAIVALNVAQTFLILSNSVINTSAGGTGRGIEWNSTTLPNSGIIANNIVQGWSGSGGRAIGPSGTRPCFLIRDNRWWNCATGLAGTAGSDYMLAINNSALTASPFTDVANLDFRVSSDVAGIGWPSALRSAALSTQSVDLGALQRAGGASGFSLSRLINLGG